MKANECARRQRKACGRFRPPRFTTLPQKSKLTGVLSAFALLYPTAAPARKKALLVDGHFLSAVHVITVSNPLRARVP